MLYFIVTSSGKFLDGESIGKIATHILTKDPRSRVNKFKYRIGPNVNNPKELAMELSSFRKRKWGMILVYEDGRCITMDEENNKLFLMKYLKNPQNWHRLTGELLLEFIEREE